MPTRQFRFWVATFTVAGVLAAGALRRLVPPTSGITLHFRRSTRYVPANVIAFWLVLAGIIVILLLVYLGHWGRAR